MASNLLSIGQWTADLTAAHSSNVPQRAAHALQSMAAGLTLIAERLLWRRCYLILWSLDIMASDMTCLCKQGCTDDKPVVGFVMAPAISALLIQQALFYVTLPYHIECTEPSAIFWHV